MYHHRMLEEPILKASDQFPVLLVTGPRQVGKTTLLKHLCEKTRRYITLDDPTLRILANDDPVLFLQRFPPPVLIDEIQYAPNLLPYIKMAADASEETGKFWLTGSQQFALMKGISESLAGRVAIINLLGFSSRERYQREAVIDPFLPTPANVNTRAQTAGETNLHSVFSDIWIGAFPALIAGPTKNRDLFYSSFLQTYLQRDVRDLAQVGNQESFVRFIKACAARTAQMLNLSELARDVDVSVNTAKHWLSILSASFCVYLLQPYWSNVTKRLVKTPKLYFLDTGLCAYLTEWSSPQTLATGAMSGPIFETYVLTEILKSWWHRMLSPQLYYYRDRDGKEIDFLFVKDNRLYPVEAKLSATPKRGWLKSFASLSKFNMEIGGGGVVCLCPEPLPLTQDMMAVSVGVI